MPTLGASVRVTVYDDTANGGRTMVGWFDIDRAQHFRQSPPSTEDSEVLAAEQRLYRTCLGRWVLREEKLGGQQSQYRFLSPAQAHDWLSRHGLGTVAARFFARECTSASQSRKPGRPEVGGPVVVRLGPDLLTELDNYAESRNLSRAGAIRDLIRSALTEEAAETATAAAAGSTCC